MPKSYRYIITHIPSGMKYHGGRAINNVSPKLDVKYNGSSHHPLFNEKVIKQNPNDYKKEIVAEYDDSDLMWKEEHRFNLTILNDLNWVNMRSNMNFTTLREKHPRRGKKNTTSHNTKISEALKGTRNFNYGRKGHNHHNFGRKHTEAEIMKMKKANSGSNNPFYGKIHSKETILKTRRTKQLNKVKKLIAINESWIKKIITALLIKNHSEHHNNLTQQIN